MSTRAAAAQRSERSDAGGALGESWEHRQNALGYNPRGVGVTPDEIRAALDRILPGVQKPGRYLGLERNTIVKDWGVVAVRLLLAFPDEYGIGMSHQGTRILYHIANARPDTLAERAFAPWPDMAAAMRAAGVPLYGLESYHPARAFDLVGITLQTELNYVNVPYLLDLAEIPRFARDRAEGDPIVVGGGPCMANPEPVADFFDAFAIGDGEVLLRALLDAVEAGKAAGLPRAEMLRSLARIPGIYVPQLYRWTPAASPAQGGAFEVLDGAAMLPVLRVFAETLDPADVPPLPIVPAVEVVQDRLGMEVVRGCTQGCRFCQAGYWYRPVREHDPATVLATMESHVDSTGYEEVGLLSLSTADYSQIEPLAYHLAEKFAPRRVGVSLPSLRADAVLRRGRRRGEPRAQVGVHVRARDRLRPPAARDQQDVHQRRHGQGGRGGVRPRLEPDQGVRDDRPPHGNGRRPRGAGAPRRGDPRGGAPRRQPQGRGQGLGRAVRAQGVDAVPVGAVRAGRGDAAADRAAARALPAHPLVEADLERARGVGARGAAVARRPPARRGDRPRPRPRRGVRRLGRVAASPRLEPGARRGRRGRRERARVRATSPPRCRGT